MSKAKPKSLAHLCKERNEPAHGVFTSPLGVTLDDTEEPEPQPRSKRAPRSTLRLRSRSQMPLILDDVVRLYVEEGRSARSIARALGVSVQLIGRTIFEHDLNALRKEYSTPTRCQVVHLRVLMNATIERLVERRRASALAVAELPTSDDWKLLEAAARLIERLEAGPRSPRRAFIQFAHGLALLAKRNRSDEFCSELANLIADYGETFQASPEVVDD